VNISNKGDSIISLSNLFQVKKKKKKKKFFLFFKNKKKKKERRVRETVRGCLCLTENKVGPIKLASVQEDENIWL